MIFKKKSSVAERWFLIDEKVRFVIAGIGNMGVRYLIFILLGLAFTVRHYQAILFFSWFLSSFTAFLAYKFLVFRTEGNHLKEFGKSLLIWCLSYFLNALLLGFLAEKMHWNVYLAQGAAVLLIVFVNYLLFKHFAFKHRRKSWAERLYNLWE